MMNIQHNKNALADSSSPKKETGSRYEIRYMKQLNVA